MNGGGKQREQRSFRMVIGSREVAHQQWWQHESKGKQDRSADGDRRRWCCGAERTRVRIRHKGRRLNNTASITSTRTHPAGAVLLGQSAPTGGRCRYEDGSTQSHRSIGHRGVAVVLIAVAIVIAVEDLLEGDPGGATINSIAVPLSLIFTAVAWYHFAVFREDRAIAPHEELPSLREVVVVGSGEEVAAISAGVSMRVQGLRVVDDPTEAETLEDVLSALDAETHTRVVVVAEDGGYRLMPLEE